MSVLVVDVALDATIGRRPIGKDEKFCPSFCYRLFVREQVLMYLDHTIGELVEFLETEGWMENSIIVVASDNGGCLNNGGSNYPLRGVKDSYWEGGSKVTNLLTARSTWTSRPFHQHAI